MTTDPATITVTCPHCGMAHIVPLDGDERAVGVRCECGHEVIVHLDVNNE